MTIMLLKHNIVASKSLSIAFLLVLPILILMRLYIKQEAYDMVYATLIILFIYFYLSFSSYIKFESMKLKKIVHFFASYAFTLYLIHYSILDFIQFFDNKENSMNLFIISIIISNFLALILAYYTEMKYKHVRNIMTNFFIKKEQNA